MYSFSIDLNSTILLAGIIFFFVLDGLLRFPLYGILSRVNKKHDKEGLVLGNTPISVIVLSRGEVEELRLLLDELFAQSYPNFEVVVVDDGRNPEVVELIKHLRERHKYLRFTFTPDKLKTIVQRKLSITLGVRAARYDWIVLTQSDCKPMSADWLRAFTTHLREGIDMVLGYANYDESDDDTSARCVFDRTRSHMQTFLSASSGFVIGGDYVNMAFRKSAFMETEGFKGALYLQGGDGVTLVGEMSKRNNTAVACEPEIKVVQAWSNYNEALTMRKDYIYALRNIRGISKMFYYDMGVMSFTLIFFWISCVTYVSIRIMNFINHGYNAEDWQFDLIALTAIVSKPILHAHYFSQSMEVVHGNNFRWSLTFLELLNPFHTLRYRSGNSQNISKENRDGYASSNENLDEHSANHSDENLDEI